MKWLRKNSDNKCIQLPSGYVQAQRTGQKIRIINQAGKKIRNNSRQNHWTSQKIRHIHQAGQKITNIHQASQKIINNERTGFIRQLNRMWI